MRSLFVTFALVALAACTPPASTPPAADQHIGDTIRQREAAQAAAVAAQDAVTAASFYAPDAQLYNPGMPAATTPEAIQTSFQQLFDDPNGSLEFHTAEVVIPSSGDYAI